MPNSFSVYELSDAEMSALGLFDMFGDLTIEPEDLNVLLKGRRTGLLRLHDLSFDGMQIPQMDAKLSLHRDSAGQAIIRVHPVYHKPKMPFATEDSGMRELLDGTRLHLRYLMATARSSPDEPWKEYEYILEYDAETREFISYQPEEVSLPDRINGFELTPAQQTDFRRGLPVNLPDGTNLVYKVTESNGLLSNRDSLILSNDSDKGKEFEMLEGIRPIGTGMTQIAEESYAFLKEYEEMNAQRPPSFGMPLKSSGIQRHSKLRR